MDLTDRIMLAVAGTLILLLALATMAIVPGGVFVDNTIVFLRYLQEGGRLEAGFAAILFLLVSLYLFRLVARSEDGARIILKETPLGDIRISLNTIHQLAGEAIRDLTEVRHARVKVKTSSDGLDIEVTMGVLPDTVIPELCEKAQRRLEDYLNSTVGLTPKRVRIYVQEVAKEKVLRVE